LGKRSVSLRESARCRLVDHRVYGLKKRGDPVSAFATEGRDTIDEEVPFCCPRAG
jgi:hypothetical protein